ncbi:MAG: AmmeMemoRadiSam system protein A [Planctomycetes bacterium]|nr:AmmeMemoRadiSam system protein A [Planctomycetota bacterium]
MTLPEHRRRLLQVARATVRQMVAGGAPAAAEPAVPQDRPLGGLFVTLMVHGRLRGCVGTFAPPEDLVRTVQSVTRSSLADSRFEHCRLRAADLPHLVIEISLLSSSERTADPLSLVPGEHGVVIRSGSRSGCFLPKVATERGWSAEMFLSNCCTMKAGLPADAWRQPDTEVYLFTAEVFSDADRDRSEGMG